MPQSGRFFAGLLLDVNISSMDGIAGRAAHLLARGVAEYPILFMTASDGTPFAAFAPYEVGAVDYLVKPIVPEVLRSKKSVFIDLFHYNAVLTQEIPKRKAFEEDLRRAAERVREFAAHIESVREDERARLAREVHDELGQTLTGLKDGLGMAVKEAPQITGDGGRQDEIDASARRRDDSIAKDIFRAPGTSPPICMVS